MPRDYAADSDKAAQDQMKNAQALNELKRAGVGYTTDQVKGVKSSWTT